MAAFAAFINLDASDIDLLAGEYERESDRAALEVAGTTLLTGARLGHGGACPVRGWMPPVILAKVRRCAGGLRVDQAACLRGVGLAAALSAGAGLARIAASANCIT